MASRDKFRLGIISMGTADAMSWYRAIGPIGALAKHTMPQMEFGPLQSGPPNWASMYAVDGIFMQRAHTQEALMWAKQAKMSGVKVWIDHDDDLLNLPPEHPAWNVFNTTKHWTEQLIKIADVFTVSTEGLKKSYSELRDDIIVIPNAVNDYFVSAVEKPTAMYNPKSLAWRGGFSHREDMELAKSLLSDPAYKVTYFGHNPPWFNQDRDKAFSWTEIPLYFTNLVRCGAGCLVVPLKHNHLNKAKSNCAWLEATWFGMATCHIHDTDKPLPEFDVPGMLTEAQLRSATPQILHGAREVSLDCIKQRYLLSKVNNLRADIIKKWMADAR